jgi:hypothetical protein
MAAFLGMERQHFTNSACFAKWVEQILCVKAVVRTESGGGAEITLLAANPIAPSRAVLYLTQCTPSCRSRGNSKASGMKAMKLAKPEC